VIFHVRVLPGAERDVIAAEGWYEQQRPGLGKEFSRNVRDHIRKLTTDPLLYPLRHRALGVRWVIASRFPYRIVYQVKGDNVIVVAIIHAARHDREWRKRA
jgi:plasmid stabilization system protein ParE